MVWGLSSPLSTAGWRSQAATVKEAVCIWAQKRAGPCSCEEQERPDETQGQTLRQRALSPSIAAWPKASRKVGCYSASWLATCSGSHALNSLIRVQYQCSNISPCDRIIEPQNCRIPESSESIQNFQKFGKGLQDQMQPLVQHCQPHHKTIFLQATFMSLKYFQAYIMTNVILSPHKLRRVTAPSLGQTEVNFSICIPFLECFGSSKF